MIIDRLKIEAISLKTTLDYEYNLKKVIEIISSSGADLLLFPEVCLTGFDYKNFKKANEFSKLAVHELKKLNKSFALSLIEDNKNYFYFFDEGRVFKRAKYNLFSKENRYFKIGEQPYIFEWRGLKIASLICFELRFIEYWSEFKGVDLILVPARWGKERRRHFEILNKALSLSTQSSIIATNSANEFRYSAILNAWGEGSISEFERNFCEIDLKENKKLRKKLNIGIQ